MNTTDPYADGWIPTKLLTREKQLAELENKTIKHKHNLFINGPKGIGKTLAAKIFQSRNPDDVALISMYSRLPESIGLFLGLKGSWRQRMPDMRGPFLTALSTKKCAIFDDVQQVQRRQDLFNFLKDLHVSNKNDDLSVVLISQEPSQLFFEMEKKKNKKKKSSAKESVESRYMFDGFPLPPLDVAEITQVLVQRTNAKFDSDLSPTVCKTLSFLADNTYNLGSDLRLALRLLRNLDECAEGKLSNYSMPNAEVAWREEKTRYAKGQLLCLSAHQAVLVTVIALVKGEISAADAYKKYEAFVLAHEGRPLDYRQILRHMDELSSSGYLIIHRADPPFSNKIKLEPSLNPENLIVASKDIHWNAMLMGAR